MIDTKALTIEQRQAVTRSTSVRGDVEWILSPLPERHVQLLGLGNGFIWAVVVGPDGSVTEREAVLGPWKETIT